MTHGRKKRMRALTGKEVRDAEKFMEQQKEASANVDMEV